MGGELAKSLDFPTVLLTAAGTDAVDVDSGVYGRRTYGCGRYNRAGKEAFGRTSGPAIICGR